MGTENKFIPKGVPKAAMHKILDYLVPEHKSNPNLSISPQFVSQYYKNFQLAKRLRGTALSLLKTQYAKFPVDHGRRKVS